MAEIRDEFEIVDKFSASFDRFIAMGEQVVTVSNKMSSSVGNLNITFDGVGNQLTQSESLISNAIYAIEQSAESLETKMYSLKSQTIEAMTGSIEKQSSQFQNYAAQLQQVETEIIAESAALETLKNSYEQVANSQSIESEAVQELQERLSAQTDYVIGLSSNFSVLTERLNDMVLVTNMAASQGAEMQGSMDSSASSTERFKGNMDNFNHSLMLVTHSMEELVRGGYIAVEESAAEQTRATDKATTATESHANSLQKLDEAATTGANSVNKVVESQEKVSKATNEADRATNRATNTFHSMGNSVNSLVNGGLSSLLSTLWAVVAVLISVKSLVSSVGDAMSQERFEIRFQSVFGDQGGSDAVQWAKQFAQEAGRTTNQILSATSKFAKVTTKGENLESLNRLSDRLALFTDKNDFSQMADSIQRAIMTGNVRGLSTATGISKNILENLKLDDLAKSGDIDGFIAALEVAANSAGMTQEAYEKMINSSQSKWDRFKNGFKNGSVEAAKAFTDAFSPALDRLNEWMDSEKAQGFFRSLAVVMGLVGMAASMLVDGFIWLSDIMAIEVAPNLTLLETLFISLGIVAVAAGIASAVTWLATYLPILLIIAVVMGLIYLFMTFTEQIVGGMAVAIAAIYNVIMFLNNLGAVLRAVIFNIVTLFMNLNEALIVVFDNMGIAAVNVATGISNVFDALGENIITAFGNAWITVQQSFNGFVSHILGGVSDILHALSSIPGSTIDASGVDATINNLSGKNKALESQRGQYKDIGAAWESGSTSYEYKDISEAFNTYEYKNVADAFNSYEYKNLGEAWQDGNAMGAQINKAITDKLDDIKSKLDLSSREIDMSGIDGLDDILNNGGDIGNVGSVGKIKDKVNIADEDLKMLVDMAEKKYVVQVNTQQISPQANVSVTNNNGTPIDGNSLASMLKSILSEQVATHAAANQF